MGRSKEEKSDSNIDVAQKGRLAEETINYFKRVEQVLLENTFEDDEQKQMFLKNVFNQMEKDGSQLTRHPLTSQVIEIILPMLNADHIQKLLLQFKEDIEIVTCDRFASHVVEALCKHMIHHKDNDDVIDTFLSFCKFLRKRSGELLRDVYGSHVLSTVLQVLGGVTVPESITKSRSARESKKMKGKRKMFNQTTRSDAPVSISTVPQKFGKSFRRFLKVIQEDDNFGELLCHRTASPVLQVLLHVINEVDKTKFASLCKLVISRAGILSQKNEHDHDGDEDEETIHRLPVVLTDEVGSHLIEAVLRTADDDTFETLVTRCFKQYIISLSIHPVANYLAQTFLRNLRDIEQAEYFVAKLLKFTEDILASGNMGCIVRLAETIVRLDMVDKQKLFLNIIQQALHMPKEERQRKHLAKLILTMMTYDVFFKSESDADKNDDDANKNESDDVKATKGELSTYEKNVILDKKFINYHGACLLKNCFGFKKSKIVVESFSSLTVDELINIACHPSGCFVFESFFESTWIPTKKKNHMTDYLLSSTYILACDKFGSRVIDAMWKALAGDMQDKLACLLRTHKSKLETDLYGRIILYNCGVKQEISKMSEIKEKQGKKRKLFEDIVVGREDAEVETPPPIKKEKKEKNDDRALKYREQLKLLGISFDDDVKEDENEKKANVTPKIEKESSDEATSTEIMTSPKKHKKKKTKT